MPKRDRAKYMRQYRKAAKEHKFHWEKEENIDGQWVPPMPALDDDYAKNVIERVSNADRDKFRECVETTKQTAPRGIYPDRVNDVINELGKKYLEVPANVRFFLAWDLAHKVAEVKNT